MIRIMHTQVPNIGGWIIKGLLYLKKTTWLLEEEPGRDHGENWFRGYDHFLVT